MSTSVDDCGDQANLTNVTFHEKERLQIVLREYSEDICKKKSNGIYNRVIKRIIDCLIAIIASLALIPIFILISIFIVLETGFPIFYRAQRGGYKGKPFRIIKFRSMVRDAENIGGGTTALHDPRITHCGAWLRKTKLDEIPQLINIIRGEMSFIGPRPELIKYTNHYDEIELNILEVRPGISDFSSIAFINLDEIVGAQNADEAYERLVLNKKNQLRLCYIARISFITDFKLFFQTVYMVIAKIFIFSKNTICGRK